MNWYERAASDDCESDDTSAVTSERIGRSMWASRLSPALVVGSFSIAILVLEFIAVYKPDVSRSATVPSGELDDVPYESNSRFFIWLSDLHGDPYYGAYGQQCGKVSPSATSGSKFGVISCDPPYELMNSAIRAASSHAGIAEFLLYTGDFVRHHQHLMPDPYTNVTNVIFDVAHIIASAFPSWAPLDFVMGALGNDDSPMNYELNITRSGESNPWLENVAGSLKAVRTMEPSQASQYAAGGFFEKKVGNLTIISINTIAYSVSHVPPETPLPPDPFGQFAWLRARLSKAAQEGYRVWIVGHIPPGIESFGHTELWHPVYVESYLAIVQDPDLGPTVSAQLFGHVHADEFRVLPEAPHGSGPLLLTGSLSPIYRCEPSFRLVEYDVTTGALLGYKIFWANLTATRGGGDLLWQYGYDLTRAYPSLGLARRRDGALTSSAFESLLKEFVSGGPVLDTFAIWYKTLYANDLQRCVDGIRSTQSAVRSVSSRCLHAFICCLAVGTQAQYDECVSPAVAHHVSRPSARNYVDRSHEYIERARMVLFESLDMATPQNDMFTSLGFGVLPQGSGGLTAQL